MRFNASQPDVVRDRVAFWLARGCALEQTDGSWRLWAPDDLRARTGLRGPCPAPIPDAVAREFIARGAAVVRSGDLFARAA